MNTFSNKFYFFFILFSFFSLPPKQQFGSHLMSSSGENEEMLALKSELSLDLGKSKMSVDDASLSSNKQNINISSASNTPNFTHTSDSTSQSVTPSEFGYQHLNRPSNGVSLENSPRSDMYESIEAAFKNYEQCVSAAPSSLLLPTNKSKSPIKSTINITYNLRSPSRTPTKTSAMQESFLFPSDSEVSRESSQFSDYEPINVLSTKTNSTKSLLETSFDDAGVYEQVKFFKGAICEVNELIDNGNEQPKKLNSQMVPTIVGATHKNGVIITESQTVAPDSLASHDDKSESDDVLMPEQELDNPDSLEFDQNVSMYENVTLRKPKNVYENIDMREILPEIKMKSTNLEIVNDSSSAGKENNKPKNFTVRQLANKFETSPVDAMPPFDFSKQLIRKSCDNNRTIVPSTNKSKTDSVQNADQVKNLERITRSLDENAFVREFGGNRLNEKINRSTHQISNVTNVLTENSPSRRINTDNTRPKSLNPPKRLPHLDDELSAFCKTDAKKECPTVEVKITPTTENPISLIQHNVHIDQVSKSLDDDKNATKVLQNFKLDRDRIERIKEERRHQLNEKFRSESFKSENENNKLKSKSKIELSDLKESDSKLSDSLQYKSKSRNEIYNKRDADLSIPLTKSSSGTGSFGGGIERITQRVRRISDEKNQNCVESTNAIDEHNVVSKARKFDRRSIDLKREQDNFTIAGTIPSKAILNSQ